MKKEDKAKTTHTGSKAAARMRVIIVLFYNSFAIAHLEGPANPCKGMRNNAGFNCLKPKAILSMPLRKIDLLYKYLV